MDRIFSLKVVVAFSFFYSLPKETLAGVCSYAFLPEIIPVDSIKEMVVPGFIRKLVKPGSEEEPASSTLPRLCFKFLPEFLTELPSVTDCDLDNERNAFLP